MTKHALIISTAALLALSACGKSNSNKADTSDTDAAEIMPITATYEFETRSKIAHIAFAPNDVASWLGALAMIGEDGALRFSDIEAINSTTASGRYRTAIGFDRPKAPALFAVLSEAGTWRGYVESSDTFDFSPSPIVGAPSADTIICTPYGSATTTLSTIRDEALVSYSSVISADGVLTLSAGKPRVTKISNTQYCVAGPDGSVLVASEAGLSRLAPDGLVIAKTKAQYSTAAYLDPDTIIAVSGGTLVQIAPETLGVTQRLAIDNGLSISGVEKIGAVFVATSPYGGTAFNEGAVFLTDAERPRVVVVSRRYFLNRIKGESQLSDGVATAP
ncbi:hypothetical protein [Robiginitomaculum antarcticum]|uniref:hypothetical protein n=1 Tax=Robiginitomaculum antarcticum TaxID=437507 RepID=UPI000375EB7D|nr:hypothetical protein [Robiginitomaculum antarcticum]